MCARSAARNGARPQSRAEKISTRNQLPSSCSLPPDVLNWKGPLAGGVRRHHRGSAPSLSLRSGRRSSGRSMRPIASTCFAPLAPSTWDTRSRSRNSFSRIPRMGSVGGWSATSAAPQDAIRRAGGAPATRWPRCSNARQRFRWQFCRVTRKPERVSQGWFPACNKTVAPVQR
jgi:hypothetical protein